MTKKQILFHLGRRYRELDNMKPEQASMARAGLSYEQRQVKMAAFKPYEPELEALGEAISYITRTWPDAD